MPGVTGGPFVLKDDLLYITDTETPRLVFPTEYRQVILHLGYTTPWVGYLGQAKTYDRISQRFYWPGLYKDVQEYCKTCHCSGCKYALVICDYQAPNHMLHLNRTQGIDIGCIELFSRIGIPKEILTDQGTNFMSQLGTIAIRTTPSHPETDGLVERFKRFNGNKQTGINGCLSCCLPTEKRHRPQLVSLLLSYYMVGRSEDPRHAQGELIG